ncbi:MAG: TonB-dependent receptor [Bacteroidota bacterium]
MNFDKGLLVLSIFLIFSSASFSQNSNVKGKVIDANTGEPLVGVNIKVKDKLYGTITNNKGEYILSLEDGQFITLVFSMVGFGTVEKDVSGSISEINISLEEQALFGDEVIVSASRYEENVLESPVSIERRDLLDIQNTPAQDFYSGLNTLKGVDVNNQSLTFKVVNTRGFTNNTNERFNQIVDGVDNAPPGLNFAAGNIFGIPELDVESAELLVGASSALYGPGGLNGTLLLNSKSPFEYQGLSAKAQLGLMHVGASYRDSPDELYNFGLRYAKAYNDKIAFKINATYLTALDWHAVDSRNRLSLVDPNVSSIENPYINPGYDGINLYGDENVGGVDLSAQAQAVAEGFASDEGLIPGSPEFDARVNEVVSLFPSEPTPITRTGYEEQDLVDYDTRNFNVNGAVHYRVTSDVEMILQGAYGQGTAVYTAQNRFSLQNFEAYTGKLELRSDNFFVRAFYSKEDAGDTYDAGSTALQINEAWKSSEEWFTDYFTGYAVGADLFELSRQESFAFAREFADNLSEEGTVLNPSLVSRPLPGTDGRFEQLRDSISSIPLPNGTLVVDKSSLWHFEGMYNFSQWIPGWEGLAGYSFRRYRLDTDGTTYADTPGNPILFNQVGAYAQISKRFLADRLKLTASGRYDRNENFDDRVTPRGSLVIALDKKNQRNLRGSVQTAFRFPSIAEQFVSLDVGVLDVFGGLPEVREQFDFENNPVFPGDNSNPIIAQADDSEGPFEFPEFQPERVTAYEVGYKGIHFEGKMLVDAYGYLNRYNGFLATQILVRGSGENIERFSTTVSTDDPLTAFGWAVGVDYILPKGYVASGNISSNDLESISDRPAGFQSRFNTPKYRLNLSLANRNVYKDLGFSVSYRWQDAFLWESSFAVGPVDSFGTLDAQVSYKVPNIKSVLKVGGSNLLNEYYITGLGNPSVGGIYYVSVTFDEFLN